MEHQHEHKARSEGKDGQFDYLVIGTGLCESMVAYHLTASDPAATVIQVDPSSVYGQSWAAVQLAQLQQATFTTAAWSAFCSATTTGDSSSSSSSSTSSSSSSYALSLQPTLVPARGAFVDALIAANVAPYLSFQLLHHFILAQPDHGHHSLLSLPGSKHDLFRMPELSLLDKRLLMRFFQSIQDPDPLVSPSPDQSLSEYLSRPPFSITNPRLISIMGALALSAQEDPAALLVVSRLKKLLNAIGRHPSATVSALPAALLLGEYGGGGEWAEGFVRAAAVTGRAAQVLGRPILSLVQEATEAEGSRRWTIRLGRQTGHAVGGEDELEFSASRLLLSQEYLSLLDHPAIHPGPTAYTICRTIAILGPPALDQLVHKLDTVPSSSVESRGGHSLVVFPAEDAGQQPVHALVVGPESGSCPDDQQVVYLSSIILTNPSDAPHTAPDPVARLQPILHRLIHSASSEVPEHILRCSAFYSQRVSHPPPDSSLPSHTWLVPSWPADFERAGFAEVVEWAAETSQNVADLASKRVPAETIHLE
ncbi:hypothetical protein PCASD_04997 [Puccinia coronata f. sp. avenae]|uniref:Rab proteins geranylgeranyltransferase n=1 Tax=Puccinia coronata f. sp. avenae TaxID=200324 RepID=A0A2N5UNP8_9BASI|nr:hypothetical protein PCASD_04997 [Puccinia coronata f. sp. avenae]